MKNETEKMTCEQYLNLFIPNQDTEGLRADYPDGLSIKDILANDTFCIMQDNDYPEIIIEPYGERVHLTDFASEADTPARV